MRIWGEQSSLSFPFVNRRLTFSGNELPHPGRAVAQKRPVIWWQSMSRVVNNGLSDVRRHNGKRCAASVSLLSGFPLSHVRARGRTSGQTRCPPWTRARHVHARCLHERRQRDAVDRLEGLGAECDGPLVHTFLQNVSGGWISVHHLGQTDRQQRMTPFSTACFSQEDLWASRANENVDALRFCSR